MVKNEWGDVPNLEGLEMEWDYIPDCRDGQRLHKRMTRTDMVNLYGTSHIEVKVASANGTYKASLRDLGEGGMGLDLKNRLDEYQNLKVGMMLGAKHFVASAQVRHVRSGEHGYTAGLQFLNLEPSIRKFLAGMYASKVLRHGF